MAQQEAKPAQAKKSAAEEALEKRELLVYSDKYFDDIYEYRHVILPKALFKLIPKNFFQGNTGVLKLLTEDEWRALGVEQSIGWEHYEVHAPEPNVLLFRRRLDYRALVEPAPAPRAPVIRPNRAAGLARRVSSKN